MLKEKRMDTERTSAEVNALTKLLTEAGYPGEA